MVPFLIKESIGLHIVGVLKTLSFFQEAGGQTGSCVELSVPSTGNPGQSSVFQFIPMVTGNTYTLTFLQKEPAQLMYG